MKRTIKALTAHEVAALAKTIGEDAVGGAPGLVLRRRGNALGEVTSARWYLRKQGSGKARIALGKDEPSRCPGCGPEFVEIHK